MNSDVYLFSAIHVMIVYLNMAMYSRSLRSAHTCSNTNSMLICYKISKSQMHSVIKTTIDVTCRCTCNSTYS